MAIICYYIFSYRYCFVLSQCFGDAPGSATNELNQPMYMCVDSHGLLLVADNENDRVRLLSPSLSLVRDLLTGPVSDLRSPHRLCLDETRGRLYVVENVLNGRVLVFRVKDIATGMM